MSFAYFPLYTGDYLRDTRHLTPLRHGVYLLLLMHCWDTKGPAPLDEQELCGISNCRSDDEVAALRYVVKRFFTKMEDGHYNERAQKEIERAENISRDRSEAGRKGYEARAKQLLSKRQTLASNPTPIPYQPHAMPKGQPHSPSSLADATKLLQFLNSKTGRKFRPTPTTLKPILARLKEFSYDECRAVIVRRWVAWRNDDKMRTYLRPDTLFNATKFAQYIGDVPTPDEMEEDNADQDLPGLR